MSKTDEEVDLTEELRRMLDERGIRYQAPKSVVFDMRTLYNVDGWDIQVDEVRGEYYEVEMERLADTPEQVVAATLGNKGAALSDETLRKDNARLRKLLRDSIELCINGGGCKDCPFRGEVNGASCNLIEEARGLGIEVDF